MIRLATRKSPLALRQAAIAARHITERSGEMVEVVPFSSLGDEDQVRPLARFLRPGAFTGRLDEALQQGEADIAVHSLKDVPLRPPEQVSRTYVLERADPADRLVIAPDVDLEDLTGRRVGTSAPRRQSQLAAHHPDAVPVDVRGSIGTRLKRIPDGELDALFVAAAALDRGSESLPQDATAVRLPLDTWPTAPGQGALALQAKTGTAAERILKEIEDKAAAQAVAAERALLADLGGGCGTPLGATALPPGHPEGRPDRWTLHVTFQTTDRPLRRFTLHDPDPDTCRQEAYRLLAAPPTSGPNPLDRSGEEILLIMDPDTGGPWRTTLERHGYAPRHWWPFTTVDLLAHDPALLQEAASAFASTDWVLTTSARAVPACRCLHEQAGALPRFAAVGPATARALRAAGLPVTLVPPIARGDDVARLLDRRSVKDSARKVLWLSGDKVTPSTEEALRRSGLEVTRVPVYGMEATAPPPLPQGRFRAVLFTSPRVVHHTLPVLRDLVKETTLFTMGPQTAEALAAAGQQAIPLPHPTPNIFLRMLHER